MRASGAGRRAAFGARFAFGVRLAFAVVFGVGRLVVFRPTRGTALFLPAATFGRR
jgi:hypothetical protein